MKPKFGKYGEHFEACASPQAIRWHLCEAERRDEEIHREITWLSEVLTARKTQIAAGEWPPKTHGSALDREIREVAQ